MAEFWETAFSEKHEMWGYEPAKSAVFTAEFFLQKEVRNVLIPGIGYGRNAKVFQDNGMMVTGIEISRTAIEMARKHYGDSMIIFHSSVTNMPFDDLTYDGIFCYALIHLLDSGERKKLIGDCYNQLADGGYMVFTTITKEASTYGQGKLVGENRYEMFGGVNMFFYDKEIIEAEFGKAGLVEVTEIAENYPFYVIKCRKG
ncbi:class I SAM-dependent methyltransferase [Fulvivirgaceae bacterium PWU5]|uniref:Class I SAM-dependent methyltransferase n=1 Tax=Dawidia cretensis TaxID=2782350 RepID=A0AAP2E258_9BACT|nr:class I SAM-dependent methyltransferase [Dawidia cretensis]MBT1710149.1 class I SAM-dependent methyltransferase [Dawidia cretensis]